MMVIKDDDNDDNDEEQDEDDDSNYNNDKDNDDVGISFVGTMIKTTMIAMMLLMVTMLL